MCRLSSDRDSADDGREGRRSDAGCKELIETGVYASRLPSEKEDGEGNAPLWAHEERLTAAAISG